MRYLLNKINTHPHYSRVVYWGKLITITGSAQVVVQLMGLLSGILIIRLLPVTEYAFYTIANTMLGTMTVLADSGISSGAMAEGGKVWRDKEKLGMVLTTALQLRKKFALSSLIISVPILVFLLLQHHANWLTVVLIVLALIPSFFAALSDSLLETIPKLHQDIKSLQKNQVNVSVARLLVTVLTVFIFPWTFVALLANGIPRMYGNMRLKIIAGKFADTRQSTDADTRKNILSIVKKIMPSSVYYCVSGQLSIWLISFFGSTDSIARIGALGRFSMLLSIFTVLFGTLIKPRFARLPEDKKILLNRYRKILASLTGLCFLICTFVYFFPEPALWILGNKYQGLGIELMLSIIAGCLSMMSGILFGISSSRGWPTHSVILIVGNILFVITGALLFDITSLRGVLWFNIFVGMFPVLMHSINFYYNLNNK